jgi:enterochelin esterase-like enzyme
MACVQGEREALVVTGQGRWNGVRGVGPLLVGKTPRRVQAVLIKVALVGVVAATVAIVAAVSGTMAASSLTVAYLGFDQVHTQLVTSLLIAGAAAGAATLAGTMLIGKTPSSTRAALLNAARAGSVAVLAVVLAIVSGAMDSCNLTLVFMGFDPDRAQLITSLLLAGVAAAAATLATNRPGLATLAGLGGFAALFGHVFAVESRNAMVSTGVDGSFDLVGWFSTLVTLATAGVISSWAGATLAHALRPGLAGAGAAAIEAIRSRRSDRRLVRPLTVVGVLILLVFTVPIFGDMVNYTPDSRMLRGGAPPVGLIPEGPIESPTPVSSGTAPGASPLGAVPQSPMLPNRRPWLSWRPTGTGSVTTVQLPPPWTGGGTPTEVRVYTPPGYQAAGGRRYPVLYEAPTGFELWDGATNVKVALDTLIDRGVVPPMIAVFIWSGVGPYPDTECADSYDGKELMDTFISQTVVAYVDSHFLTIARPDARAITGFSQGGYCAAMLALRHPTVFATSIPFSGYFRAGVADGNVKAPFGGDPAAMAAASPVVVAAGLPAIERSDLLFIVVAKAGDPFFGAEATNFESVLAAEGYRYVSVQCKIGHGWIQVRQQFMAALEAWSAHLVATGVF